MLSSCSDNDPKIIEWCQANKWVGNIKISWHYVKDIPNKNFKHLLNQMNEYKPVSNSRDTQEISFYEGIQMLEIFRDFQEDTSVLNDFDLYEKPLQR